MVKIPGLNLGGLAHIQELQRHTRDGPCEL